MSEAVEHPVALLLDAENVTSWCDDAGLTWLLEQAAARGPVRVRRAYGNWAGSPSSLVRALNRLGFDLAHVYHPTSGKNSADIHMTVDAMDLLATHPEIRTFVLATGDSDFSPLFRRLRERGKDIVGCGPRSALSETVASSCARFILAEELPRRGNGAVAPAAPARAAAPTGAGVPGAVSTSVRAADEREPARGGAAEPTATTEARKPKGGAKLLARAMEGVSGEIALSQLRERIVKLHPGFSQKAFGHKTFQAFVRAHPGVVEVRANHTGVLQAARATGSAAPTPSGRPHPTAPPATPALTLAAPAEPSEPAEPSAGADAGATAALASAPPPRTEAALRELHERYEAAIRPVFGAGVPPDALVAIYEALAASPGRLTRTMALALAAHACPAPRAGTRALHRFERVGVLLRAADIVEGTAAYTVRGGLARDELVDLVDEAVLRRLREEVARGALPWEPAAMGGLLAGEADPGRIARLAAAAEAEKAEHARGETTAADAEPGTDEAESTTAAAKQTTEPETATPEAESAAK